MSITLKPVTTMARKNYNLESGEIRYNNGLINRIIEDHGISARSIMGLFNHTNQNTIKRWRDGEDIYLNALIRICNAFRLNLLQFIEYEGRPFETHIENLYRMEAAGIRLADILADHGVEPFRDNCNYRVRTDDMIEVDAEKRKLVLAKIHPIEKRNAIGTSSADGNQMSPVDIITRITAIQREDFEHERKALEALRKEMQEVIDDKDEQITRLKVQLARAQENGYMDADKDAGH